MKIFRQYIVSALLPALTVFIAGLFKMSSDCGQCMLLLMVGSALMFLFLLLPGLFYFLMKIKLRGTVPGTLLGIVAAYSPAVLLTMALLLNYYEPERNRNTDFEITSPAIVASFFVSTWTFYLYLISRREVKS